MIDREELLELVTTEDIIQILEYLGSDSYRKDNQGNIYFQSVCHCSDSHKLYYFSEYKIFKCFTTCGSMSLYDLIITVKNISFKEAFKYVCDFKGISTTKINKKGLQKLELHNQDLDFLKIHLYKKDKQNIKLPYYDRGILKLFNQYIPLSWSSEGISEEVAKCFDIGVYFTQNKAIIPHYDINGGLVGIRARSFNNWDIENGKKYMPITIQGLTYRYPMNFNLYGLFQNKENIKRYKKVIIFESEKSVLLYGSYYGQENNIALASSGMTISLYQRSLLLSLGVEEIIIAYDKQYQVELLEQETVEKKVWKEYEGYVKRLIKISNIFIDYCNLSIIFTWDDRLRYKDSPIDNGKKIFEELYKERHLITDVIELEEMIA